MPTTPAAPADTSANLATDSLAGAAPDAVAPAAEVAQPAKADVAPAATAARLAELFPALFAGAPKPLKLRIQIDIQERAPGVFSKQALAAFFRRHTGGTAYLIAVSKGQQRFDLDGQPAGELSEEHRQVAADELARRRALGKAKREQADQAQHQAQQQAQQERRNRATLLRDFETTRLTTANFCALKGLPVEALDGLLARAREEAKEDALRPRRPEHGPREHARRDGPREPHAPRGPRRDAAPREGRGPRQDGRPPRRPAGPPDKA